LQGKFALVAGQLNPGGFDAVQLIRRKSVAFTDQERIVIHDNGLCQGKSGVVVAGRAGVVACVSSSRAALAAWRSRAARRAFALGLLDCHAAKGRLAMTGLGVC